MLCAPHIHKTLFWHGSNLSIGAEHVNMVHQLPALKSAPPTFVHILWTWPCFAQEPLRVRMRGKTIVTFASNSPPWYSLDLNAQGVQIQTRRGRQPEPYILSGRIYNWERQFIFLLHFNYFTFWWFFTTVTRTCSRCSLQHLMAWYQFTTVCGSSWYT